ncbi:hypothetical protein CROQUDRAFT_98154 [Cronartium quercuum f. sp. fusiforme G11]|uniref:Uncharacterized protein n=1 Tax=Cronartium quercuum f. sp. fusiforme G11 TaxID=708437 RepID=A0A9P6NAA8_9BASI|nr:hypothetical protein CROQUDRAFT_98154 [Cronartium quercuum f. sp. fusiforme G11]
MTLNEKADKAAQKAAEEGKERFTLPIILGGLLLHTRQLFTKRGAEPILPFQNEGVKVADEVDRLEEGQAAVTFQLQSGCTALRNIYIESRQNLMRPVYTVRQSKPRLTSSSTANITRNNDKFSERPFDKRKSGEETYCEGFVDHPQKKTEKTEGRFGIFPIVPPSIPLFSDSDVNVPDIYRIETTGPKFADSTVVIGG